MPICQWRRGGTISDKFAGPPGLTGVASLVGHVAAGLSGKTWSAGLEHGMLQNNSLSPWTSGLSSWKV